MTTPKLERLRKTLKKQYDEFVDDMIEEMSSNKDLMRFLQKFEHINVEDQDIKKEIELTIEGNNGESKSFYFKS